MHKWFTASGEHVFWSEVCNNVSYVSNHDPYHKVVVGAKSHIPQLKTPYTIVLHLSSCIPPYEELYYYGKLSQLSLMTGAVQTALFIEEYSSLTRCNPNLTVLALNS